MRSTSLRVSALFLVFVLLVVCAARAEGEGASAEDESAQAQIVALSNQLDKLLSSEDRDSEAIADIYLKLFELAPHQMIGKLAALDAYAYLSGLGQTQAALGLLERMSSVYLPDEECPNLLDAHYPLRLPASAKIEKARLLAKDGLYQLALEELGLVRRGRKAGTEGFSGMPVGQYRYFAPTEVLVDLLTAEFTSKLDPAAGLVSYRSVMERHKSSELAWLNLQGVRCPLDRIVVEKVFDVVKEELFLFARADSELKAISSKCWTDECRAEALWLRARLREARPEGEAQAKMADEEELLTALIKDYQGVLIRKHDSGKVVVEKPSCMAAMELASLYKRAKQHARGSKKLQELLENATDRELKGHIVLALAEILLDAEGPSSPAAQGFYRKCLTEYAFELYYPYSEQKPRYLIDAVPVEIKRGIIGEPRR